MKKKVLAALLAVCMLASLMFVPASAAGYDDVADDHWAKEAIDRWSDYDVLHGVTEGKFSPDRAMTRAEFATMVVNLMGLTSKSGKTFPDVEADSSLGWAKEAIDIAATNGIITGYSDGTFGGKREVTFEAGATMLGRALGLVTVEETSGDKFHTAAAEKLEELGMLDENVKADMTFDRAGVAGLADNMIGAYVTPETLDKVTEDGVITGDVKGVILVVAGDDGVAVTVKDATVSAIVMQGGNVELTGKTTVDTVKVGGGNAIVTADKDTTVGGVSVEGTNASVALDGKVDSVTVAEDATVSKLEGEGVSSENVTNESANDITVNDETVAAKPAEPENPDEDEDFPSTGFVPTPSQPAENPEGVESAEPDTQKPTTSTDAGTVAEGEGEGESNCAGGAHTWKTAAEAAGDTGSKKATCTEAGYDLYKCETGGCTATKKVTVPALGHKEVLLNSNITKATCTAAGTAKYTCANTGCDNERSEAIAALGHQPVNVPAKAATCTETGLAAGIACGREGCEKDGSAAGKFISGGGEIAALGHSWTKVVEGDKTTFKCTRTGCTETSETCPKASEHANILTTAKCPLCGAAGAKDPDAKPAEHQHSWATAWSKDATNHWHACTGDGDCQFKGNSNPGKAEGANGWATHTWGTGTADGTRTCSQSGCGQTTKCSKASEHPTEAGESAFTCSECSYHLDAKVSDPNGG